MTKNRFESLSRMVLNNWHYINHRVLSFHDGINFFTGHSGSGKSTVIDALQIVLYANTDGRGFFNKAAADDSDRNLMEYLRGMVNIGENNEFSYLRNHNFSSTIVLELKQTDTERCQCVGVVFDVDTAVNEKSHLFFWHEGPIWENQYRTETRTMTIEEVKGYLQEHYSKEDYSFTSNNERFRKQLYDVYLGGLDKEKFPPLFKRAIPFRMNIKLEDFVKEYICMEQDIHIEDMQESVMQYGRLQQKIADTREEIAVLSKLNAKYKKLEQKRKEEQQQAYFERKLQIRAKRAELKEWRDRVHLDEEEESRQKQLLSQVEASVQDLERQSEQLLRQILESGYESLKEKLAGIQEQVQHLSGSKMQYQNIVAGLKQWENYDGTYNSTLQAIAEFEKGNLTVHGMEKLQRELKELRGEVEEQHRDARDVLRELKKEEKQLQEEWNLLNLGNKAYPREVEAARNYLIRRLGQETGKGVQVEILADLLEIEDETWRNAVEGYLGSNKLTLIVEPRYAKLALEIYKELDPKQYHRVAVLDTERVEQEEHPVLPNALAGEVSTNRSYVRAYLDFLLGKVIKCNSKEELRQCRIGITPDCVIYHSYRIQHMNPDQYTRFSYIGKNSVKQRKKRLGQQLEQLAKKRIPQEELLAACEQVLAYEALQNDVQLYQGWLADMETLKQKQKEKEQLLGKLELLREQTINQWEEERAAVAALCEGKKREISALEREVWKIQERISLNRTRMAEGEQELLGMERVLDADMDAMEQEHLEAAFEQYLRAHEAVRLPKLMELCREEAETIRTEAEQTKRELVDLRTDYLRTYVNRTQLSPTDEDNARYEALYERLSCEHLDRFEKEAEEQAKAAVEHFRDDFIFKIRNAIKEALVRKDELNRVISRLDFGKDKYQFVIGKNKGAYGIYYDMFMDEALEINPMQLKHETEYQMDLFSMEHENRYGEQMNELIRAFIPPEHATAEQLEEARRNMEKFADYRTYLSFDMQQIIQNEDGVMKIGLSKMIRKNSGGEGQNPLYVALLASFAQAYRINLTPKLQRRPTIRLVVLDEAFSKMDAEKVASCIELIRSLGFQALISATNDKIQNYLENVDKTFVFANPRKNRISIQEFERAEFGELEAE